jgi:hypothetical protein
MSYTIPPAVINQRIADLRKLWERLFPLDVPSDAQFRTWFSSHSFLTVAFGLSAASQALCRLESMTMQDVVKYASKVMLSRTKILKQQQKETTQCKTK